MIAAGIGALTALAAVALVAAGRALALPVTDPQTSASADIDPRINPAQVREGVDYTYLAKVQGHPVKWPCATGITVTLVGKVPTGTMSALRSNVEILRGVTGLDLTTARADRPGAEQYSQNVISVYYRNLNGSVGPLDLVDENILGQGGPRWDDQGVIYSGSVLIRADDPLTSPTAAPGRRVLLHELAHALGLGHATSESELMAPMTFDDSRPTLGTGDITALSNVGCRPAARSQDLIRGHDYPRDSIAGLA